MSITIADSAVPVVKHSLEREVDLLCSKIQICDSEIKEFEKKYGLSSKQFIKSFEEGAIGDDQDYFEWYGLLKIKQDLENEKKNIMEVISTCM
ncbi:MAG: hypothetical protein ACE5KE_13090 [Methanosarcinales archaeon]